MKNWRKSFVVIMVVCFSVGMLAACNDNAENEPIEPVSEVISEEVFVAEPSVVEEESISEEILEETGGVEYFNFANKAELMTYLEELNQTTVVWYNFSEGTEQAIIPNGEKYTIEGDNSVTVISTNKNIVDVRENVDYIDAMKAENKENQWGVFIETTGTDLEVSFTVVYEDGTEEDFTIYVTKE